MPEEISNQYFLNSRSDGKNGVKSTRRREVRTKQRESMSGNPKSGVESNFRFV